MSPVTPIPLERYLFRPDGVDVVAVEAHRRSRAPRVWVRVPPSRCLPSSSVVTQVHGSVVYEHPRKTVKLLSVGVALAVLSSVAGCSHSPPEGPLAFSGNPSGWTGDVVSGTARAWGLIRFGREGLHVRIERVDLKAPLPSTVHARTQVNIGSQVGTGASAPPPRGELRPLPRTVSGPVQIVIWLGVDQSGVRYSSPGVDITYSIGSEEYRAPYAVGVTVCGVKRLTRTTACR